MESNMDSKAFVWDKQICEADELTIVEESRKYGSCGIHVKNGESQISVLVVKNSSTPTVIEKENIDRVVVTKPGLFCGGAILFIEKNADGTGVGRCTLFEYKKKTDEILLLVNILKHNIKNIVTKV